MFRQAVKHEAKLRLAIAGPSGSGKTYTALAVGTALADGGKVAVVDTERGSASKYADIFNFDVMEMEPPFHPDRFVEAIEAAEQAGYTVLILDYLSHTWKGAGGLLEMVDLIAKKYKGNTYAAWGEVDPIYNRFVDTIVAAKLHVIGTLRSKQDYVLVESKNGKSRPQKVGMAPVARDGFEYEFDVLLQMDIENNGVVDKTRCPTLTGAVIAKPGAGLAETLRDWLSGEKPPTPGKLREMALAATTAEEWAYAAYRLPVIGDFFDNEKRLEDWLGFVADEYQSRHADVYLDVLDTYTGMLADGVKVKLAAEKAREMVQAIPADSADEEE